MDKKARKIGVIDHRKKGPARQKEKKVQEKKKFKPMIWTNVSKYGDTKISHNNLLECLKNAEKM